MPRMHNGKWANQLVGSSAGLLKVDANGYLECPESHVQAMLNSGFTLMSEPASKPKAEKAKPEVVEEPKVEAKVEPVAPVAETPEVKEEEQPKAEEPRAEEPKRRRWKRSE